MKIDYSSLNIAELKKEYMPECSQKDDKIYITTKNEFYTLGKCFVEAKTEPGINEYEISFQYTKKNQTSKLYGLVSMFDENDEKLFTDYMEITDNKMHATVESTENAVKINVEFILICKGEESVVIEGLLIEKNPPKKHRKVKVATAWISESYDTETELREVLERIDSAGNDGMDIICFTETVYGLSRLSEEEYITDDSEVLLKIKEAAKKNSVYVIFSAWEKGENGLNYITAFLISDEGELVGRYRKIQPALCEILIGAVPGDGLEIFETRFGKIAVLICWDLWFSENMRKVCEMGAEIVFWPTLGYNRTRQITRAIDNGMYVVSSAPYKSGCAIVNSLGEIIADGTNEDKGYVFCEIDLDERIDSIYKSFGKCGVNDKTMFLNERRKELY